MPGHALQAAHHERAVEQLKEVETGTGLRPQPLDVVVGDPEEMEALGLNENGIVLGRADQFVSFGLPELSQ